MTSAHRYKYPPALSMSSRITHRCALLCFSASIVGFAAYFLCASGLSFAQELPIEIDSSRVVYNENQSSATIGVRNKSDIPYLISVNITEYCGEGKQCPSTENFMASPGFRVIRPGEKFPFRLVKLADSLPTDRESLYLVEFKLLPSEAKLTDEELNSSRVTFVLAGTLKLFWRPKSLANTPGVLKARDMLAATCTNRGLQIQNRSAYWGTFAELNADGHSLLTEGPRPMVAPFSDRQFKLLSCPKTVSVAFIAESGLSTQVRSVPVRTDN